MANDYANNRQKGTMASETKDPPYRNRMKLLSSPTIKPHEDYSNKWQTIMQIIGEKELWRQRRKIPVYQK